MNEQEEIWKPIQNLDGYEASNLGRIRSLWISVPPKLKNGRFNGIKYFKCNKSKILKQQNHAGYNSINIKHNKKYVHRLVMEAFNGVSDLQVNHKNLIRNDNRLENLEYVTPSENSIHAAKNGRMNGNMKLSEHEVNIIRMSNIRRSYLSKIFHVTPTYISHIKHFNSRKNVPMEALSA